MCVTNIAKRNRKPVAVNTQNVVGATPSLISQRLMGNFMPLMLDASSMKPSSSVSTTATSVDRAAPISVPANWNCYSPQLPVQPPTEEKKRPKRRRKPQKPGKTAKQNDRHFVVHNYHDHAEDPDENDVDENTQNRRRGGVTVSFPMKLHAVLDQVEADGLGHIVSWSSHGRCFVIHKPKDFVDQVMPNYFRQSKLTSFQRQLNLYGFSRLTRGQDSGGYYHELFLRGKTFLTKKMTRTKIKGTKFKAASSPDQEPDFYSMPPVVVTPPNTGDECSTDGKSNSSPVIARRRTPAGLSIFQNNDTSSLFEPLPVPVCANPIVPAREPYPLVAPLSFAAATASWDGSNIAVPTKIKTQADEILDEAVEELFSSDFSMKEAGDLDSIWDTTNFGEEAVNDDTQLGYLLEQFLEE